MEMKTNKEIRNYLLCFYFINRLTLSIFVQF